MTAMEQNSTSPREVSQNDLSLNGMADEISLKKQVHYIT